MLFTGENIAEIHFASKGEKASESINTPKTLDWNRKAFQTISLS